MLKKIAIAPTKEMFYGMNAPEELEEGSLTSFNRNEKIALFYFNQLTKSECGCVSHGGIIVISTKQDNLHTVRVDSECSSTMTMSLY